MPQVTIYHNPRCSKSRRTLSLLEDQGIEPEVIEYLKSAPDEKTIKNILQLLGLEAKDLIRKKEYLALGQDPTDDPSKLIALMSKHPEIIERPIVVHGRKACLGRPPENVLEIL